MMWIGKRGSEKRESFDISFTACDGKRSVVIDFNTASLRKPTAAEYRAIRNARLIKLSDC